MDFYNFNGIFMAMFKKLQYILTILIVSYSFIASEAKSQNVTSSEINTQNLEQYNDDLARIEKYLNSIKTIAAPFTQESSDGEQASGTFYLSRPGKLRWEYDPPTPILIIAKGSILTYYDSELNQVSHIGLDDSLSGFLTRKDINFKSTDIKILNFEKSNNRINVTISQKGKEEEGQLTLTFSDNKISLQGMSIEDAIGKTTDISFITIVYDKPLGKKLFTLPKVKK